MGICNVLINFNTLVNTLLDSISVAICLTFDAL